jgi:hypothetical protein
LGPTGRQFKGEKGSIEPELDFAYSNVDALSDFLDYNKRHAPWQHLSVDHTQPIAWENSVSWTFTVEGEPGRLKSHVRER